PGSQMDTTTSISPSGEYAVVTAAKLTLRWMRVFDLTDCQNSTEYAYVTAPTTSTNCAHRNFKTFIESSIPSFSYFTDGEFLSDDVIAFYHRSSGTPYLYTRYFMSIAELGSGKYLSLGDSLSAGEGTNNYIYPTDGHDATDNKCHTSNL